MTREEVNQTLNKLCEYGGMMLDWQYVEAIRIAAVFYETGKDTATKEKQTERKCESCKYHDECGGCLDSSALCRYTPQQTAKEEASKVRKSCNNCKWVEKVEKSDWGYICTCHKRECQDHSLWEPATEEGE